MQSIAIKRVVWRMVENHETGVNRERKFQRSSSNLQGISERVQYCIRFRFIITREYEKNPNPTRLSHLVHNQVLNFHLLMLYFSI